MVVDPVARLAAALSDAAETPRSSAQELRGPVRMALGRGGRTLWLWKQPGRMCHITLARRRTSPTRGG